MSLKLNVKEKQESRYYLAIDGDIIAYSCAAASDGHYWLTPDGVRYRYKKDAISHCVENGIKYGVLEQGYDPDPIENALHSAKVLVESILEETQSTEYKIFLSGENNFRKQVYPDYKANRDELHKPHHLYNIREYLIRYHSCVVSSNGYEADDLLATHLLKNQERGCICSLDKDLDQIPGLHYNWPTRALYRITEREGLENLYKQFLIGDRVDNIDGVYGLGKKKSHDIISACEDEQEMRDCVLYLYDGDWDKFKKNLLLLKVGI